MGLSKELFTQLRHEASLQERKAATGAYMSQQAYLRLNAVLPNDKSTKTDNNANTKTDNNKDK